MKIIVNTDIGTFRLSTQALDLYRKRGGCSEDVKDGNCTSIYHRSGLRADPLLVRIVEELGPRASGPDSQLEIVEVDDRMSWRVFEVCGFEVIIPQNQPDSRFALDNRR
jgi:hypothetical protein